MSEEDEEVETCDRCSEEAEAGQALCETCQEEDEEEERREQEEEEERWEVEEARRSPFIVDLIAALQTTKVAVETTWCCGSCSASAGGNRCGAEGLHGYAYFHDQDLEGFVHSDEICVGFGAADGSNDKGTVVGQELFAAIKAAGLNAEWNESVGTRITVKA